MGKMAQWTVPKKFLCKYELRLGANIYAILMIVVMIIIIIAAIVDMLGFKSCANDSYSITRSAYAFSTVTIIYSVLMTLLNIWYLWGAKKGKPSSILVWVVVTSLWLTQTTLLTVVMLGLYMADVSLVSWIICVVCSIAAFLICLYGVLVGYGLWVELKGPGQTLTNAAAEAAAALRPVLPKQA